MNRGLDRRRNMARHLFTVENTFIVPGRELLVLLPGIVPQGDERFTAGDTISLRRPDGSVVEKQIASLELMNPTPSTGAVAVVLKDLRNYEIPLGTEVWSID